MSDDSIFANRTTTSIAASGVCVGDSLGVDVYSLIYNIVSLSESGNPEEAALGISTQIFPNLKSPISMLCDSPSHFENPPPILCTKRTNPLIE